MSDIKKENKKRETQLDNREAYCYDCKEVSCMSWFNHNSCPNCKKNYCTACEDDNIQENNCRNCGKHMMEIESRFEPLLKAYMEELVKEESKQNSCK